jgi:hypothetical protein
MMEEKAEHFVNKINQIEKEIRKRDRERNKPPPSPLNIYDLKIYSPYDALQRPAFACLGSARGEAATSDADGKCDTNGFSLECRFKILLRFQQSSSYGG